MGRRLPGERLLGHLSLAAAVILVSTVLGPISLGVGGPAPLSGNPLPPASPTVESQVAVVQPTPPDGGVAAAPPAAPAPVPLPEAADLTSERVEAALSSRGGVPLRVSLPTPTPTGESTAAATSAVVLVEPLPNSFSLANPPSETIPPTATAGRATVAPVPPTGTVTSTPARSAPAALAESGTLRVGIQAGHWKNSELPAELAGLRGSTGAAGKGWKEVDVNVDIATRVAATLRENGIQVDLIPATVPVDYRADAFVALHGDANSSPSVSGYKLAHARWSKIPQKEDALIRAISTEYQTATGLKEHPSSITEDMRQYYAFDWQDLKHAVDPATPSVILEMGFLTTASDRQLLLEQPDRAARGIALGILKFLGQ